MLNIKIQNQAVLVAVKITKWSNAKTDKSITEEVTSSKNADSDMIRVRKNLIKSAVVKAMSQIAGRIRNNLIGKLCVPWAAGEYLLNVDLLDQFEREWEKHEDRWNANLKELGNEYDNAVSKARTILGDAFDESDYPSRDEILAKYSLSKKIRNLPSGDDLRVSLPQAKLDRMKADIENDVTSSLEGAMQSVHERVAETLAHLIEKLTDFGVDAKTGKATGVFRDSTVTNLTDLASILPSLNLTGDPKLTEASNSLLTQLRDLDPEKIRNSESHRKDVVSKARDVADKLSGFFD
tara:strand:- start:3784 stop:4665 length:882 start_codon:yes stop_codon:yes gene_type:complete